MKRSVWSVAAAGVVSVGLLAGVAPVAPSVAATGVRVNPVQAPSAQAEVDLGVLGVLGVPDGNARAALQGTAQGTVQVKTYKMEAGGRYRLRGHVTPKGKRPVVLSEKKGRKWKKRAKTVSARNGKFAFLISAGSKVGKRQFMLTVPAHKGRKGYSARFNVKVVGGTPPATPTDITIAFSATSAVSRSGQAFTVTGSLTGGAATGRAVVLQQAWADGWHDVVAGATDAAGGFTLTLPATWLYTSQMRVYAAPVEGAAEGASAPVTVSSTPGWTPQGANPAAWAPLTTSQRTRWNPCGGPITVQGNFAGAPAQAREALMQALGDVGEATGLTFSYVRDTTGVAQPEAGYPAFGTDVALGVSWVSDAQTKWDMSGALGVAGPRTGSWGKDAAGKVAWATSGEVAMNTAWPWTYERMLGTYRHELSHVFGLGHTTADSSQLMWWQENAYQTFGVGDLAGLAAQGAQAGCVTPYAGLTAVGGGPEFPVITN